MLVALLKLNIYLVPDIFQSSLFSFFSAIHHYSKKSYHSELNDTESLYVDTGLLLRVKQY